MLPYLREIWDEEGWENHWWPEKLRGRAPARGRNATSQMATQQQTATVWQGRVPLRVHVQGEGPAVVFLHGPWGLTWGAFLDALAKNFKVYAPEHPGTTPGEPDTVHNVDTLWDLVLCYDELLDHLHLDDVRLVGHSFGAMMACEVAALRPSRIRRLALIDPIGLWRDDAPVDQLDAAVCAGAARLRVPGARRRGGERRCSRSPRILRRRRSREPG